MVKILSGLVAAIVIAVGGFFGFQFYTQQRIAGEVETALEQIRAAGGKASHGKISFDLLSRTVKIADLAAQSAAQPPISIKIGSLTASGVSQPDAARFSAESIEITDVEIGAAMAPQPAMSLAYKVPRIIVKDYSGPASLQRPPASSSFADVYRSALEQFAGVTAASITVPSLTGTINSGVATPGGGEVAYTGFAMQGIKDGKIASMKVDGVTFTVNAQPRPASRTSSPAISRMSQPSTSTPARWPPSSTRRRPATTSITASTGRSRRVPMSSRPDKA